MTSTPRHSKHQSGFTLLEALIAIVILSFGILSLAAVYAQGIQVAAMTQMDYIAEKKAEEAVETIFAARDSKLLVWTSIQNVSNAGVFLNGPQPLLAAGPDGHRE
jgi:prepilin-type N-terminal cleavage/methylation domain-containing protein